MNIPHYPQSRPLELEDHALFREAFSINPPVISEFTFTNLYAWRKAYKLEVSRIDGLLLVSSAAKKEKQFFEPIGKGDLKAAIKSVLRGSGASFIRLPETIKELLAHDSHFELMPDTDNFDYLYHMKDLVELPGRKYDGKRNLIKKFKSLFAYEYTRLSSGNIEECLEFQERWCKARNCDSVEGLKNEKLAIGEMIRNFSRFELIGGAIMVKGRIHAVAIAQKLNPETLVMHVLKADPDMPGLYQAINNEFLKNNDSYPYVNLEQDLGIEGLRKAKRSYHPLRLVHKYTLSLKHPDPK